MGARRRGVALARLTQSVAAGAAAYRSRGYRLDRRGYDHTLAHIIVDMPTAERVTVTLRAELLEQIDRVERNRSRFIAQAVEHELDRRRREALLLSIAAPHPESVELADAPLGDWVSDLPADEELVDRTGGTAVRWVDGEGWVTGP